MCSGGSTEYSRMVIVVEWRRLYTWDCINQMMGSSGAFPHTLPNRTEWLIRPPIYNLTCSPDKHDWKPYIVSWSEVKHILPTFFTSKLIVEMPADRISVKAERTKRSCENCRKKKVRLFGEICTHMLIYQRGCDGTRPSCRASHLFLSTALADWLVSCAIYTN